MNKLTNLFCKTVFFTCLFFLCILSVSCQSTTIHKTQKAAFQVYSDTKDGQLDDFLSIVLARADEIIDQYNPSYNKTVKLKIFNTIDEFHKALKITEKADWLIGCSVSDHEIWMVNPYNAPQHSYDEMKKVVVHEFTHAVLNSINKKLPVWIHEGIACYEADQNNDSATKQLRKDTALSNQLPFYETLDDDLNSPDLYVYPLSIIEFIETEKSQEKLIEFIKNPNTEEVFGMTKDEFQEEWRQYLIRN